MATPPVVVLIGPAATGKSALGQLLAEHLGAPFVDIDEVGDNYYAEVGWGISRLVERISEIGRVAAEREWEPARAHAVCRAMEDHSNAVLALGAGHTSFTGTDCLTRVRNALSKAPHVVLLLPSEDRDQSLAELRQRSVDLKGTDWVSSGHDFLAEWLDDQSTRSLATKVVITNGDSPEATASQLASYIRKHPSR